MNPRLVKAPEASKVSNVNITGAKNFPDDVKTQLLNLEPLVRKDLLTVIIKIRRYLSTGMGNPVQLNKELDKYVHILNVKGEAYGHRNNSASAGHPPNGSMVSFAENP